MKYLITYYDKVVDTIDSGTIAITPADVLLAARLRIGVREAPEEECPPTDRNTGTTEDSRNAPTTPPPPYPVEASSSAEGASSSEAPKRVLLWTRWRSLNSKMHGEEAYRLAIDGDRVVWIEEHPDVIVTQKGMGPRGFRASERKCHNVAEVPVGLIVITIKKNGATSYEAARVQVDKDAPLEGAFYEGDGVRHVGCRKVGNGFVHVLEIDGHRREFRSEG